MTRREFSDPFGSDEEDDDNQLQVTSSGQLSDPKSTQKDQTLAPSLDPARTNVSIIFTPASYFFLFYKI